MLILLIITKKLLIVDSYVIVHYTEMPLLLHMCIAPWVKILFFHPKYSFSAQKILQTFLQGWHP